MKTLRTIIVDDNRTFRDFLKKMLLQFDYVQVVSEAGSEKEGLREVEEHLPNLIILDIQLLEMGGFELARILTSRFPGTGVIFITLFDNINYRREAKSLGFPFVPKSSILEKLPPILDGLNEREACRTKNW
jgi:DNA-binding NarL/FixJ family response regulator